MSRSDVSRAARRAVAGVCVVAGLLGATRVALAQNAAAPIPPEVITRDAQRRATIRAIRLNEPLRLDGRLDEAVYTNEKPITDFIQTLPIDGAPTEKTEAWVMFDATTFYVAARCYDSAPPDQWIANEMRRDTSQLRQNDTFGVTLDTFHDRRNAFVFYANPIGGRSDQTFSDEGNPNLDWNPVWDVRTGRFEGGWTIEMAIPFKSLRYVSGTGREWGIQMRRAIRRKNEWVHLNPLPLAIGGAQGFFRISAAATLVGLDLPPAGRNIELKPYAIAKSTTDLSATPQVTDKLEGDAGIDMKYGITANLTADLTYHTDFAQVEVDEQQVNLTRFNLFFPEKREFFLEGRGVFSFAQFPSTGNGGNPGGDPTSNTPFLFYSRKIGLNKNRVVPIVGGGRITGKVGGYGVGVLNIEADEEDVSATPQTNFSVVRVKRDILRRSTIGAIFTNRSRAVNGEGSNQVYGADAIFSLTQDLVAGGYYARSATEGLEKDNDSYQARIDYAPDRYGGQFEYLKVGDHFNPEVGFLRREDFSRTFASARFSPRPKGLPDFRQIIWQGSIEHIENPAGLLESESLTGRFNVERQNSDQFSIEGGPNFERLVKPFEVAKGIFIPVGSYDFNDVTLRYNFGQQRRASGNLAWQVGQFYDGDISALTFSAARVSVTKQLSVEPTISVNHVTLPAPLESFTTTVLRARSDFAFSPWMFASGLVQYNSNDRAFTSNFRFRWEYRPGSELFLVYTDDRNTDGLGYPDLKNRAIVVKVNRLFRF